jgi:CubicO group peptidase (beta-lactamase class C family)
LVTILYPLTDRRSDGHHEYFSTGFSAENRSGRRGGPTAEQPNRHPQEPLPMTDDGFVPDRHAAPWQALDPAAAGFEPVGLQRAVAYAEAHETPWPRDLEAHIAGGYFEPPPDNAILGPIRPRGGPNGLILRHGRCVARWGDTRQIDATFSVAKSYLGILAGLAVEDGRIDDLDAPVARSVPDGGFEGPHNGRVTWRQLLQQTSEWEGTLWDKSDVIDRNRQLAVEGRGKLKGQARPLKAPGEHWEYNDVRVNRLSLALLRRFGRALPDVFRARIMDPIGASPDWTWTGYRNSSVEIDGKQVQSVSGGSHWGGGVFIHAEDQARIGLLALRRGRWGDRQLIPAAWIARSIEPCALNPLYGLMWWLNTGRAQYPSASAESVFFKGAGSNITWIDPATGIVAVLRWIDPAALDGFLGAVMAALRD